MEEPELRDIVVNPIYVLAEKPLVDDDVWIAVNVREIEERGAEAWLRDLLRVLRSNP